MAGGDTSGKSFEISRGAALFEAAVCKWPGLWRRLGALESDLLADRIAETAIERPVYVCGLARSGSTILLEMLASIEGVATHRYRDFPPIFTPYLWNRLFDRLPKKTLEPVERSHLDGILVTAESPEAFEEAIWMAFFQGLHDPKNNNVLDERSDNPAFERFYRDHLRKILLVRGSQRYVAKGNYNLTRLAYLLKLFPDARFVLPLRRPAQHIASLMKQHRLFCEAERKNPRILEHMRLVGHFEFGLDRRPINTGADSATREVEELWRNGEEVRGWARYWSQVYGFLADQLEARPDLAQGSLVVRYEDLCERSEESLSRIVDHCGFSDVDAVKGDFARRLEFPTYYKPAFSEHDLAIIESETGEVGARFGY